jgi:signal transduction histidine kinase
MTIRTRMTLWYSGVLLGSALLLAAVGINEWREHHSQHEPDEDNVDEAFATMGWIGLPALALSIGGGWWLMRKALGPVALLTRAAEGINEHNLGEPLPRSGNGDELDRLSEVLNGMNGRLNSAFARIREFTLHASHELKTPLTVLWGETETELRDESLSPEQRERAASRLEELRRLTRIVDGLTLLAKADAGLISLSKAPVALDQLVRDSFEDTRILAQAARLKVELADCDQVTVEGDAHRLRQLLLNLADNAVKHNQPDGAVSMALRRTSDAAVITVANTGPGIPEEILPRVFERFYRGDPAHSRTDGCGLGLSIAQWIVRAHRGAIAIESNPGELTTVTVRLPLPAGGSK